jgi:hypothetical protein
VLEFPAQHSPQGAELESEPAAAKLRTGNIRSADSWEKLLLPEIERQQKAGKEVILHADAAFGEPEKLRKMAVAHTQQADGAGIRLLKQRLAPFMRDRRRCANPKAGEV